MKDSEKVEEITLRRQATRGLGEHKIAKSLGRFRSHMPVVVWQAGGDNNDNRNESIKKDKFFIDDKKV